jgi:hypothetical protein
MAVRDIQGRHSGEDALDGGFDLTKAAHDGTAWRRHWLCQDGRERAYP